MYEFYFYRIITNKTKIMNELQFEPKYIIAQFSSLHDNTYMSEYEAEEGDPIEYATNYKHMILQEMQETKKQAKDLKLSIIERIFSFPYTEIGGITSDSAGDDFLPVERVPSNLNIQEYVYVVTCIATLQRYYNELLQEGGYDFRIELSDFTAFLTATGSIKIHFYY